MTARVSLLLGSVLCIGWAVWSCGNSQEESARWNQTLGGSKDGAPLVRDVSDPGILQDAVAYQPAKAPGARSSGAAPGTGKPGATGGDAGAQVRTLVNDLVSALKDKEVELALKCFNAEQIKALTEDRWEPLYTTLDLVDQIARRLGPGKADRLLGVLRGAGDTQPKVDALDADHASVTPNLATVLFGSVKQARAMSAARGPEGWKFQLDGPLTDADVEALAAFHKKLQAGLNQIIDWLDAAKKVDEAQLKTAVAQALQGEPITLEAPPSAEPEEKAPGPTTEPEKNPEKPAEGGEQPGEPGEKP
jgi:hypothetical protein